MASLDVALVSLILADPTLASPAMLGAPMRLTPDVIPQGTSVPAMSYQRVSTENMHRLRGTSSLTHPRIQLTLWCANASSRTNVKTALRNLINTLNDQWADRARSRYVLGIRFGAILISNVIDSYEPASRIYQSAIDLTIWYNEAPAS